MYVIVIGLSAVGDSLARSLVNRGHSVAVIDKDGERCKEFASEVDTLVIHGDAEDKTTMEDAGVKKADALVAATGNDSVNLMACTMAKEFQVPTILVVVRDPNHVELFKKLGVAIHTPDEIMAEHLYQALFKITDYLILSSGNKPEIFGVSVNANSEAANKRIKDINLPEGVEILMIYHKDKRSNPSPNFIIQPGDEIVIFASRLNNLKKITEVFTGKHLTR